MDLAVFRCFMYLFIPIDSSKVTYLEPMDGSIMVTSKNDANSKNSSFAPVKFCKVKLSIRTSLPENT